MSSNDDDDSYRDDDNDSYEDEDDDSESYDDEGTQEDVKYVSTDEDEEEIADDQVVHDIDQLPSRSDKDGPVKPRPVNPVPQQFTTSSGTMTSGKRDDIFNGTSFTGGETKKYVFVKELGGMMYGCGDAEAPLLESVHLLEDMVIDFMVQMTRKAVKIAERKDRITANDVLMALRDRPRLRGRAVELLELNEQVRKDLNTKNTTPARKKRRRW